MPHNKLRIFVTTDAPIMKKRIVWVDWAKALCMFLVVLGHSHIQESDYFASQFIYSFHMPFFFFISGLLCTRDISFWSIKKDLKFLILPYLTFGLTNIVWGIMRVRSFNMYSVMEQLKSLVIGDDASIGAIWFLPALFICKQLFLVIKLSLKYNRLLYYGLIILSFLPIYFISANNYNMYFFADSALCGLPFFCMGNLLYPLISNLHLETVSRLGIAILLLSLALCLSYSNGQVVIAECSYGRSVILYYLNSVSAILAITLFCTTIERKNRFIRAASYGTIVILGFHGYILTVFNYYLPIIFGITPHGNSIPVAILYSAVAYGICYLLILKFDKYLPAPFGLKGNLEHLLSVH